MHLEASILHPLLQCHFQVVFYKVYECLLSDYYTRLQYHCPSLFPGG